MNVNHTPNCLLILGCGYVGSKLAEICIAQGIKVKATVRQSSAIAKLKDKGVHSVINENPALLDADWLMECDAVLDSIPLSYQANGIPFQEQSAWVNLLLDKLPSLKWAGYLSATSVYADSHGAWIDETSIHFSDNPRGMERRKAEHTWLTSRAPSEIFRLAGIYGTDRNIVNKLMAGSYKTVAWQPAHYSNRIHVDDIVAALLAAMSSPQDGRIINLSDDEPCPHVEYVCDLAEILGAPKPVVFTAEEARQHMSAKYLSFFKDNKRISNTKLHQTLLSQLQYPSFRDAAAMLRPIPSSQATKP